jgi:hypothetical protein
MSGHFRDIWPGAIGDRHGNEQALKEEQLKGMANLGRPQSPPPPVVGDACGTSVMSSGRPVWSFPQVIDVTSVGVETSSGDAARTVERLQPPQEDNVQL